MASDLKELITYLKTAMIYKSPADAERLYMEVKHDLREGRITSVLKTAKMAIEEDRKRLSTSEEVHGVQPPRRPRASREALEVSLERAKIDRP